MRRRVSAPGARTPSEVKLKPRFNPYTLGDVTLAHARPGERLIVERVGGERSFRRRLLELGFVPGTPVELIGVAPLGDPIELLMRGCSLSIRRGEALWVSVRRTAGSTAGCCDTPAPAEAVSPCAACGKQ